MSDRLLVGTRKGLFRIERDGGGRWSLARSWFLGDPVSMVLAEAGGRRPHAALDLGHFGVKLRRTEDDGETWSDAPVPAFPPKPDGLEDKDPVRGLVAVVDREGVLCQAQYPDNLAGDEPALFVPAPLPAARIQAILFASKDAQRLTEDEASD